MDKINVGDVYYYPCDFVDGYGQKSQKYYAKNKCVVMSVDNDGIYGKVIELSPCDLNTGTVYAYQIWPRSVIAVAQYECNDSYDGVRLLPKAVKLSTTVSRGLFE